MDEKIATKQKDIDSVVQETAEIKKRGEELHQKYTKEISEQNKDQIVIENKCKNCFLFRNAIPPSSYFSKP